MILLLMVPTFDFYHWMAYNLRDFWRGKYHTLFAAIEYFYIFAFVTTGFCTDGGKALGIAAEETVRQ